jgi:tetratricopeptide (TPR) repeat protein
MFRMQRSVTAEESYRRGRDFLERGEAQPALEHFRTAHQVDRANPRYRSFYGLGLALVERRFDRALELCRSAANLARVHLAFGFKAEAIRYLRRGLMIDPGNTAMLAELNDLGLRRRPVLSFLPRRHPINRLLGRFFGFWRSAEDEMPAPQSASA